jgi:hypothetical protein
MALRQTPLKRFINVNCSGELIRSICRTRRRAAASSPSLPPSQLKPATRAARITASFRPPSWWRLRFLRPATACSPDERSEIRERDTSLNAGPGFRWRSSGLRPETGHGFKVRAATTLIEASYDLAGRDGASLVASRRRTPWFLHLPRKVCFHRRPLAGNNTVDAGVAKRSIVCYLMAAQDAVQFCA